jgi:hypothetical protein
MHRDDEFVARCRRKVDVETAAAKLLKRDIGKYGRLTPPLSLGA